MTDSVTGLPSFEDFLSQAGAIICCDDKQYLVGAADIADFFQYIKVHSVFRV